MRPKYILVILAATLQLWSMLSVVVFAHWSLDFHTPSSVVGERSLPEVRAYSAGPLTQAGSNAQVLGRQATAWGLWEFGFDWRLWHCQDVVAFVHGESASQLAFSPQSPLFCSHLIPPSSHWVLTKSQTVLRFFKEGWFRVEKEGAT